MAAFAAFHPLCADGDPPASDAGVAVSASMRRALPPLCDVIMVSLSARACPCGAALPFQAWPSVASAGDAASALSTFAIGSLLLAGAVCLPAALGLVACAGVATLAVCACAATLASCAATAVLASCADAAVLVSCPAARSFGVWRQRRILRRRHVVGVRRRRRRRLAILARCDILGVDKRQRRCCAGCGRTADHRVRRGRGCRRRIDDRIGDNGRCNGLCLDVGRRGSDGSAGVGRTAAVVLVAPMRFLSWHPV